MKSKSIILYTGFFILSFIILSTLNFFYKSVVTVYDTYTYSFSAEQYFGFKEKSLEKIFYLYFSGGKKISKKKLQKLFKIENKRREVSSLTLNKVKSSFTFDLITKDYFDENKLQEKINNIYLEPIRKIVNDIESKKDLYNYEIINQKYLENNDNDILNAYYKLTNSKFFTRYPPNQKCVYNNVAICYEIFSKYYLSLYYSLKDKKLTTSLLNKLKITNESFKEENLIDVLNDFQLNRYLFDNYNLNKSFTDYSDEYKYFSKKYDDLINSDFFIEYMPSSYCENYSKSCFEALAIHFNKILTRHKLESELPFKVYFNKQKNEFNLIKETPLILGISIMFTYIFFILTNKYFRKKLK